MAVSQRRADLSEKPNHEDLNLQLRELEAELNLVHVAVAAAARRWQLAGQDPGDAYRGLYISDAQAQALLSRPFATGWGNLVELPDGEVDAQGSWNDRAEEQLQAIRSRMGELGVPSRIRHLYASFDLNDFERQVFRACLAPFLDLRYQSLYAYLQDDITRKHASINLMLDLYCPPGVERLNALASFSAQATLRRERLIHLGAPDDREQEPRLDAPLQVDPTVARWLVGHYEPEAERAQSLAHVATAGFDAGPYAGRMPWASAEAVDASAIYVLGGADRAPKRAAAHWMGRLLDKELLEVRLDGLPAEEIQERYALASRDARLLDAVLYVDLDDADTKELANIAWGSMTTHAGPLLIAVQRLTTPVAAEQRRVVVHDFKRPNYEQRRLAWRYYLERALSGELPAYEPVAAQFQLTSDQIRTAALVGRDLGARRGQVVDQAHLYAAARSYSNPGLEALARKIKPHYDWEDIVLPGDQVAVLRELVNTVRLRPLVLEEWGLGRKLVSGTGITALFSGPPGTGKTMAAEIIAGELYLDLYKIDLSTVVSKYIGETEKNLERIFAEAEYSNAILFFDEADALFGKRSEVRDSHDRYANIEISYLLQRMEAYEGVTILATNLRSNLDEAFTRRLQFVVDFPFPETADRLRIWQTLFPADLPQSGDLNFGLLASRFRLAGGNIRNVIVSAAYLAADDGGVVEMRHLFHGTRRELQKMGRLINQEELEEPAPLGAGEG